MKSEPKLRLLVISDSLISNLQQNKTSHKQIVTSTNIWGYVTRICREHLEIITVHSLFILKKIVAFQC